MFDPLSLGLGYGAWKLAKYIYEEVNKSSTPPDPRKEEEVKKLTEEPTYLVVAILAKFAKADGIVTKNEIATVEEILREIEITGEDRTKAIGIFRKYKDGALSYEESLALFADLTENAMNARGTLCILLLRLAHADGVPSKTTVVLVRKACDICEIEYSELFRFFQEQQALRIEAIAADYELLGCSPTDSEDSIKAKYRHLTKTFHPDTIAGKDLPPEFIKVAEAKFREIQEAYERIKLHLLTICVEQQTVECPHCDELVEVAGDGEYECPHCGEDIVVGDGESDEEPFEVECPHCDELVEVASDGEYECPHCGEDIVVGDGESDEEPFEVECPHCDELVEVASDGEYKCPWCKNDFVVE